MGISAFCLNCKEELTRRDINFCSSDCKNKWNSKKRNAGSLEGKTAVRIDKKTTIFISDPSKAEYLRKKYIRHIGNVEEDV